MSHYHILGGGPCHMDHEAGAQRVDECQTAWDNGTCPDCGEPHYEIVRRGRMAALEARLQAVEAKSANDYHIRKATEADLLDERRAHAATDASRSRLEALLETAQAEARRLREALNHGFCRKCGESVAPHGGSDPEHRWPY